MECPACGKELKRLTVGDVAVDVCQGACGGAWFDQFELKKFDEPHEEAGVALLGVERVLPTPVDRKRRLKCPKCDDSIMMRHFFSVKREVEVDECPECAGFWLDFGELGHIRSLFNSEAERRKAARHYFRDVFGEELAVMKASSADQANRARRIAQIFRFVCPSQYIPQEQEWGAY